MSYLDVNTTQIDEARREHALASALRGKESEENADAIVKRAEVFESYLRGGAPGAIVVTGIPVEDVEEFVEGWKLSHGA